jgi:hypothetical protein
MVNAFPYFYKSSLMVLFIEPVLSGHSSELHFCASRKSSKGYQGFKVLSCSLGKKKG